MGSVEDGLRDLLEDLLKQLGRKQKFENAVVSIGSVLRQSYASAPPPLRQLMYLVVCRVATILKTRYTVPGFWLAGLQLFELAEGLVSSPSEKEHLRNCIAQAREQLDLAENLVLESTENSSSRGPGYLFEGHLTVDPEPPRPQWLVQSDLVNTVASLISGDSSEAQSLEETASTLLQELIQNIDAAIPPELLEALPRAPRAPPASKEVVAKLPIITLSEEILAKLGKDAECAVCREELVVNEEMQELPCKHLFHPPCLKPWLDEHNSCPICRHELRTDDHAYESSKEREKEDEEERKGAANAVRGGEYISLPDHVRGNTPKPFSHRGILKPREVKYIYHAFNVLHFRQTGFYSSHEKTMQLNTLRFCSRFHGKYPESNFSTNKVLIGSSFGKKRPCWRMIADGYAGSGDWGSKGSARSSGGGSWKSVSNGRIYRRQDSCLVIPSPYGKKPRGIIKFLGGAFIGAIPEVTYSYLIELLAKEGYLVISVPYNVTFDHSKVANEIYEKFHGCLNGVLTNGLPEDGLSAGDLADLPLFSVGHSNGALLQVLVGSYFAEKIPKANAIISYNNRPASEAVPYFEQFGPLVKQTVPLMEASPVYSFARSASGDAFKVLLDTAGVVIAEYDKEAFVSLNKFVDQLPLVLNQVTEGFSEFRPTPSENRDFFKTAYNVQHTLLVKFGIDPIDETDLLEETLRPRVESIGGTLDKIQLSGNHITPCAQEPKWQAGYLYTPADAIAQGIKTLSLNETRLLARTVSDWLRRHEN